MPGWGQTTWFYRYLVPPVREVLEAGPAGEKALRAPRHADVCVLFTDIRGFTELSRVIEPEVLSDTVNLHVAHQARSVDQYGGYVYNFTGDGLMALFEGERMEERACRCALDIMDTAQRPPAQRNARSVPLGVGLHAGHAVFASVGCESWRTYTAMGKTVNTAARLCDHARRPPGVIVSETVRRRSSTATGLAFEPLGGALPQGVDSDLGLYRLRAV